MLSLHTYLRPAYRDPLTGQYTGELFEAAHIKCDLAPMFRQCALCLRHISRMDTNRCATTLEATIDIA